MCVIVCGKNKDLAVKDIDKMWESNSHGAGVAWNNGSEVMYRKGFMKKKDLVTFLENNGKVFKRDWLIHFRLASIGSKDNETLTHPFVVSDNIPNKLQYCGRQPIIAHNGSDNTAIDRMKVMVINNRLNLPAGEWSDSRAIALMSYYCGKNLCNLFSGKFAYMTPDKIHLLGKWETEDGYDYSNLFWKHKYTYITNHEPKNSWFDSFPDNDKDLFTDKDKFANNMEE